MLTNFKTIADAASAITQASEIVTGYDIWRRKTYAPSLADGEGDLKKHGVLPTSKQDGINIGTQDGLWFKIHMRLLIPAIHAIAKEAKDNPKLDDFAQITDPQEFFKPWNALAKHIQQRKEWSPEELDLLVTLMPSHPYDVSPEFTRKALDLESPAKWKHPFKRFEQQPLNSMLGRLAQAKRADGLVDPQAIRALGFKGRMIDYLAGSKAGIFERNLTYFKEKLPECPIYDIDLTQTDEVDIEIETMFQLYAWFANPDVVEMVQPGLLGAAQDVAYQIAALAEITDYNYKTDLQWRDVPETLHECENFITDLGRIGRLISDAHDPQMGKALIKLAFETSTKEQRIKLWGSEHSYIPDKKRNQNDPKTFMIARSINEHPPYPHEEHQKNIG